MILLSGCNKKQWKLYCSLPIAVAQSRRVTEHHCLSTIVDKNEESGWISSILVYLETFLVSSRPCTPGCTGLLCLILSVLVPHLVWSATAQKQECSVKAALNACSVPGSVSHLGRPGRGGSGAYSTMSLKATAHAALSSRPCGLSASACSGGDTKPRYCLLDLVSFFSSLVNDRPFLLSSRAACKSYRRSEMWFNSCLLAGK